MHRKQTNLKTLVLTRFRGLLTDCDGYLDPGSGSYILQVAMAGLLGGVFALKSYWMTLKTTFRDKFSKRK